MKSMQESERHWKSGQLYMIDMIPWGDEAVAGALEIYTGAQNSNTQGRYWSRALTWAENILFGLGRHYVDEIIANRISADSAGNLNVSDQMRRRVPRPVNDLLGRYIETNISIMTENRPVPRITPNSDSLEDQQEAKLSELNIEYLWEELDMPEQHREIARLMLYTGVAWLEVWYDPLHPRHMLVPQQSEQPTTPLASGLNVPVPREVAQLGPDGSIQWENDLGYGDIVTHVVSGFEMYLPEDHYWNRGDLESGWIMRESYHPIAAIQQKYLNDNVKSIVTKKNGYFRENIEKLASSQTHNYALWWWERLGHMVEGSNSVPYVGTPDQMEDYVPVRVLDRKPNNEWPKGRTIITAGGKVIYDSPKDRGARVYDKRWPHRWHPYVRYRWEAQPGSIYGRSMVNKMLPYLKRIDSIDATMIMWRRTVPIASWILPKGSSPVEGLFSSEAGNFMTYDPNRTARNEPKPVYPPPYPSGLMQEREMAMRHLEDIAGTEQILRGERPTGTTSAAMLSVLRNLALSAKSPILQSFDESLQMTASALNQETKKHIQDDERFRRRIMILAREKASQFTLDKFSGSYISDNVNVKIDTVSQAMFAKEAKAQRAIEVVQFSPNLVQLPISLQTKLLEDLGWPDVLSPQGPDVARGRMLIQFVKSERFDLAIPIPEDDPYVLHDMLVKEIKTESMLNWSNEVLNKFFELITYYQGEIQKIEQAKLQMQMQMGGEPQ